MFTKQLLLSYSFTEYLISKVSGANYPAVREVDIKDCQLGLPPLELQDVFSKKASILESQKGLIRSSISTTADLLSSRMDKYFNI